MTETLLSAVGRFADANADAAGIARTPVPGLMTVRQTAPTAIDHAVWQPLIALVVQGEKRVTVGTEVFELAAGDSLLISADVPTTNQVLKASAAKPYYSFILDLDITLVADLAKEMSEEPIAPTGPARVDATDAEVADTALRLMRLIDRPTSVPVLAPGLLRELHYWLLAGRHGAAIRQLGWPNSQARRIAKAVAVLRADYAQTLPVERLAAVAGMSPSSFHQHFRAVTSLSPLQFQKQLRLIEARRQMLIEGASASNAAYAVGYESVSQFTREYGRMFGMPPVRETAAAKTLLRA
jgi:AraC-like DNA-binding protein